MISGGLFGFGAAHGVRDAPSGQATRRVTTTSNGRTEEGFTMDAINRLVLPGLFLCIVIGVAIMGWLIYKPPPREKLRQPQPKAAKRKIRKVL